MKKKNLETYWYEGQIKSHIKQFLAVFSELKVSVGNGQFNDDGDLIEVAVAYGSRDRVVNAILSDNTQNKPIKLPAISGQLIGIEPDPSRRKGLQSEFRHVQMPRGGDINTDLRTYQERIAIPYRLRLELSIYTSNTEHSMQLLEQILSLFDPDLQLQTSDNRFDNSRITTLELESITDEQQYPAGTTRRVLVHSLVFNAPIYLRSPKNIIDNVIKKILIKIDAISSEFSNVQDKADDMTTDGQPYQKIIDVDEMDLPPN